MKTKYLIETSAVPAAVGHSTPEHTQHFDAAVADGELYTSIYVRKETIRRFICDLIEIAEKIAQCSTPDRAIHLLGEGYGRKPKAVVNVVAMLLQKDNAIKNTPELATAVAQLALNFIWAFDLKLASRVQNTCGCRKGGVEVEIDFRNLLRELSEFRKEFLKDVEDCPVNRFLQLGKLNRRSGKLLACDKLNDNQQIRDVRDALRVLFDAAEPISCKACSTIGDPIIAMEQPKSWTLVHIDSSFDKLCECTDRDEKKIASKVAATPTLDRPAKE